jgi:type IV pilus assembly protein PilE
MQSRQARGMTFIELLMVVVIVGVLAAVAVPGYRGYLLRAGRTEARSALLALATAEEKLYLRCYTYTTRLNPSSSTGCSPATLRFPLTSERGYYSITVIAADAAGWAATATRVPGTVQAADTKCRVFGLTSAGLRSALDDGDAAAVRECWDR